ncbi:unnamed protein product [Phytomonas sp. EM1]|nr:unnamed protein product [Phytomonas sp. EM1]|eukprot:CCW63786.1 unnamed protein product [Phytomonas sp. isolate EM1]
MTSPGQVLTIDKNSPPACILRVPLDARREAYLEDLVRTHTPLVMRFRRVLRADAPPEWEDHNASHFEALLSIDLTPLEEPGAREIVRAVAPLEPRNQRLSAPPTATPDQGGLKRKPSAMEGTYPGGGATQVSVEGGERTKKLKTTARRAKAGGIPATLYEEPDTSAPHPYLAAGTFATVSLKLSHTLAPLVSDRVRPDATPQRLLITRQSTRPAKAVVEEPGRCVANALDRIVKKVLGDYQTMTGAWPVLPPTASSEEKEEWRRQFFDFLQSSGQVTAYKAYLTPLVVRLVREKLSVVSGETISGDGGGEKHPSAITRKYISQLSNELYVYLLDCVHSSLNNAMEQYDAPARARSGEETQLSEGGIVPGERSHGAKLGAAPEQCTDPWITRAMEAESSGDYGPAETYHQARVTAAVQGTLEETPSSGGLLLCCVWTDAADFYVRIGEIAKAEQSYREAIACNTFYTRALLAYGMLLMAYDRLSEAAVYVHSCVEVSDAESLPLVWGCIALLNNLYMLHVREGSSGYEAELAQWERERRLAVRRALLTGQMLSTNNEGSAVGVPVSQVEINDNAAETAAIFQKQTNEQEEIVFMYVARYATQLQHSELANICLARCRLGCTCVELLYARLFAQNGQHRNVLETLDTLDMKQQETEAKHMEDCEVDEESGNLTTTGGTEEQGIVDDDEKECFATKPPMPPRVDPQVLNDEVLLLRAQSKEALGHLDEAIHLYKAALCKTDHKGHHRHGVKTGVVEAPIARVPEYLLPTTPKAAKQKLLDEFDVGHSLHYRFSIGYLRLGNLLLGRGRFKDATGVFTLGIQAWPLNSLMWLGTGIGYYRAGNIVAAEVCLNKSNVCNPLNPRTWAFLTLLCMRTNPEQVQMMLEQTVHHGLSDVALWAELGCEMLITVNKPMWSIRCLQHALNYVAIPTHDIIHADEEGLPPVAPVQQDLSRGNAIDMDITRSNESMASIRNVHSDDTYTSGIMQGPSALHTRLASICLYYLSHALLRLSRIEEARRALTMIIRDSTDEVLKAKAEMDLKHCA